MSDQTFYNLRGHVWDDDAVCIYCGFDGAEDSWLNDNLRREIGDDEFKCRKEQGEFDAGRYCKKQPPVKVEE